MKSRPSSWISIGIRALLLAALLLIPFSGAHAQTGTYLISQENIPYFISAPGKYIVTENLTTTTGAAITILARNVQLDLNGFTISGPVSLIDDCPPATEFFTTGIRVEGAKGARISNGRIEGFTIGISLSNAVKTHVNGLAIEQTCWYGIELYLSNENFINNNQLTNNFSSGIRSVDSHNNLITANTILNNDGGISMEGSNGNTLSANTIAGHPTVGVVLVCSSDNHVESNSVTGNLSGIAMVCDVSSVTENVLYDNNVSSNFTGIEVGSNATLTQVRENVANDNTNIGIQVAPTAIQNRIQGNQALNNGVYDVFDWNLPACLNTWIKNTFTRSNDPGGGCIQ
jgi:parallel beta-helix repeat protein